MAKDSELKALASALRKQKEATRAERRETERQYEENKHLTADVNKLSSELMNLNRQRSIELCRLTENDRLLNSLAGHLLKQGAEFVCVDAEEPYYLDVYRTIRRFAIQRGTWNKESEVEFRARLEKWLDRSPVKERDHQRHVTPVNYCAMEPKK